MHPQVSFGVQQVGVAVVVGEQGIEDEGQFLEMMAKQLRDKDIRVKKMMSGKLVRHDTGEGELLTRKLMISDLEVKESVLLQQQGLSRSWSPISSAALARTRSSQSLSA